MNRAIIIMFTVGLLLAGCSHTNKLAKYNLTGQKIFFEEVVAPDAGKVLIVMDTPAPHNDDNDKKDKDKKDKDKNKSDAGGIINLVSGIAKTIGTSIVQNSLEDKLQRVVKPDEIANIISYSVEKTLTKYMEIDGTRKLKSDFGYISTTTLKKIQLTSVPDGIYIRVDCLVELTDRKSGEVIWDNSESVATRLKNSGYAPSNSKSRAEATVSNIVQLTELSVLSDEQIHNIVSESVNEVGKKMADTLKDDIFDARKGK